MSEILENKFIVRFRENGNWFNLTDEPVSKETAQEIYDQQTYYGQLWVEPNEKIYFQMKEVG